MRTADTLFVAALLALTPAAVDAQPVPGPALPSGWVAFDHDADGRLQPLEFGEWVMTAGGHPVVARRQANGRYAQPAQVIRLLNLTSVAFSRADSDRDLAVTPVELERFVQQ